MVARRQNACSLFCMSEREKLGDIEEYLKHLLKKVPITFSLPVGYVLSVLGNQQACAYCACQKTRLTQIC